ncbi:MAG: Crp/Fnr family transcriptional regulator [Woeseiaceae bacterium]|nr:Crp/Fnr family transcriptional regulator [Woeseiaceae bacterium]
MSCSNRHCPFFKFEADGAKIADDAIACVVNDCTHVVEFDHGEVLFMQGQPSSNLFALNEGMVKICSNTADGREQIVGLSSPSNLLVGLQSLNEDRYAYTAVAATPVRACRINHHAMLAKVRNDGGVAVRLIEAINAQLAHSRALMEVMGHRCAASKIAAFILLMTPKSTNGNGTCNCQVEMPFSRVEMAGLLGLSEETVCRSMAMMKRMGAVNAPRGRIEIRDWDRLHAIADECCGGQIIN